MQSMLAPPINPTPHPSRRPGCTHLKVRSHDMPLRPTSPGAGPCVCCVAPRPSATRASHSRLVGVNTPCRGGRGGGPGGRGVLRPGHGSVCEVHAVLPAYNPLLSSPAHTPPQRGPRRPAHPQHALVLRRQQVAPRLHAKGGQHALRHLAHARHLPAAQGNMLSLRHLGQRYRGMKSRGHLQHCWSCSSRPAYPPHWTPCHPICLTGEAGHA